MKYECQLFSIFQVVVQLIRNLPYNDDRTILQWHTASGQCHHRRSYRLRVLPRQFHYILIHSLNHPPRRSLLVARRLGRLGTVLPLLSFKNNCIFIVFKNNMDLRLNFFCWSLVRLLPCHEEVQLRRSCCLSNVSWFSGYGTVYISHVCRNSLERSG